MAAVAGTMWGFCSRLQLHCVACLAPPICSHARNRKLARGIWGICRRHQRVQAAAVRQPAGVMRPLLFITTMLLLHCAAAQQQAGGRQIRGPRLTAGGALAVQEAALTAVAAGGHSRRLPAPAPLATHLPSNVQRLVDSLLATASPRDVPRSYRGQVAFATTADAALLPLALRAPPSVNSTSSGGGGSVVAAAVTSVRSSRVEDWVAGFLSDSLAYSSASSTSSAASPKRRRHLAAAKGKQPQRVYQWQAPGPPLKKV